ncbi:MAG: hypothetical protein B6D61_07315, partial [Bacteroidetes bacterium 4484_249]
NYETIGQDIDMTFFPEAAEFADGILYRCRNGINIIYFVAQDGTETELGEITGTDHFIADMTFDENTGIMYFLTNTFSPDASFLHILDMQTFELFEIGQINDGVIVTIELAGDGFIYGIDIAGDNIWKINKETASGDIVGSIGFDANFDQSLSYDTTTGTMYAALYEYEPVSMLGYAKFCQINLSSGDITIINDDYEFGYQICAFAVLPSQITSIKGIAHNNSVNIYPNPSKGVFNLNLQAFVKPCSVSITDITGKTIYKTFALSESEIQIDLSNQPKGIYNLKLITNNNHFSEKIIVQ